MESALSPDMDSRLRAARSGDDQQFALLVEPHQHELKVHCYRMLGSMQDAEDMLQETMLRAWRKLETYEGRASFRAWLYRIATNICLDQLKKQKRRSLPQNTHPAADPQQPFSAPIQEPLWLEPCSDEFLHLSQLDELTPEARFSQRESITLAFLVALHSLPPKQRAVLLLREVLAMNAKEVASVLEISLAGVNSALYRARLRLVDRYPELSAPAYPADEAGHPALTSYLHAWERGDVDELVSLMKEEITFAMPPVPSWYQGREAVRILLSTQLLAGNAAGRWRLLPTIANAQPAFAFYRQHETAGFYTPFGIHVLSAADGQITGITHFFFEGLFPKFGLPERLS